MWSWEKKKEAVDVEKLTLEKEDLQRRLNLCEDKVNAYKKQLEGEYAEASFSVDWKAMNAFSIERNPDSSGIPKTIIGFMLAEPVVFTDGNVTEKDIVREWTFYCSHDEHQRLVADFNKFVSGK